MLELILEVWKDILAKIEAFYFTNIFDISIFEWLLRPPESPEESGPQEGPPEWTGRTSNRWKNRVLVI